MNVSISAMMPVYSHQGTLKPDLDGRLRWLARNADGVFERVDVQSNPLGNPLCAGCVQSRLGENVEDRLIGPPYIVHGLLPPREVLVAQLDLTIKLLGCAEKRIDSYLHLLTLRQVAQLEPDHLVQPPAVLHQASRQRGDG